MGVKSGEKGARRPKGGELKTLKVWVGEWKRTNRGGKSMSGGLNGVEGRRRWGEGKAKKKYPKRGIQKKKKPARTEGESMKTPSTGLDHPKRVCMCQEESE